MDVRHVGRIAIHLVGPDGPIDHHDGPRTVHGVERSCHHGEIAVGQLHDLTTRLESDTGSLGKERVVVAAVKVLATSGELMEVELALLRREDDTAVGHEARG
jgi:hypothetical protein